MNLHEKMKNHPVGKYADFIDCLIYNYGCKLDEITIGRKEKTSRTLREIAHILEGIAFEDFKKEADKEHKWVVELAEKREE